METLEAALPLTSATCPARLAHSTRASRERLLLMLLFLNAVGLRRTWDLRGYTGTALALLTQRQRAYSYRHTCDPFARNQQHCWGMSSDAGNSVDNCQSDVGRNFQPSR